MSVLSAARPLAGQAAVVTGAAVRIGRAIALALAAQGADVCVTYRSSGEQAARTVADLHALGVNAFALRCDLANAAEIPPMMAEAAGRLGRVDLLVNNAGLFASEPMEAITAGDWDAMFAVNTRAPFLVAQALLEPLRRAQGRIVNVGSLGGLHPWSTHAHYCTSKAALHMLSQTMAKAWAPELSVNCVAPGMIVQGEVDPLYERFAEKTPMGRNGTAEDVAAAVLIFATAPRFITGQLLAVDGGLGL